MPSGECPACHADTNDARSVDPNKSRILVTEQTIYPQTCCTCMAPTGHRVIVQRQAVVETGEPESEGLSTALTLFSFLLGPCALFVRLLFATTMSSGSRETVFMRIAIPQCKACFSTDPITADFVDMSRYQMGFVVHRAFAELLGRSR